ncbi:hypothetical protein HW511_07750 [Asaia siamensis]|uniref:Uncharacterized protein n=1 Tax=Asaia siamensis TaxID=110479 RepID=A0ABQ1LSA1_9PROT|nr:hypothetical protein [Asaia siamensis]GGC28568.1 hypothetical protein GCM10007207_12510 [Asaia siamensis]
MRGPALHLHEEANAGAGSLIYGGPTPLYLASAEKTLNAFMVFEDNVLTEKPDDISVFLLHMAPDAPYFVFDLLHYRQCYGSIGVGVLAKG